LVKDAAVKLIDTGTDIKENEELRESLVLP
jgi:hypothetical protein